MFESSGGDSGAFLRRSKMSSYPKFIYHPVKEEKIVLSKEEHDAHGDEWKESPAHFEVEAAVEAVEPQVPKKRGRKKAE
jgi:hypothetical protein